MEVDLVAIHEALAVQLGSVVTVPVRVYPFATLKPEPPPGGVALIVAAPDQGSPYVDYRTTFGPSGRASIGLVVQVMARATVADEGLRVIAAALSEPADSPGVWAAIESDMSLGGLVETLQCSTVTSLGFVQLAGDGPLFASAEIPVLITLRKA